MDTVKTQNSPTADLLAKPNIYDDVFVDGLCNSCRYQETLLITPDGNFCADCCTLGGNNKKVKLTNDRDVFINGSCNACKSVDKLLVLAYGNFCADCCTFEGCF